MPVRKPSQRKTKKPKDDPELLRKRQMVEVLVEEVEQACETYKQQLRAEYKIVRERLENQHELFIAALPEEIRNMPVSEFMERGLDFKSVLAPQLVQKVDSSAVLGKFMKKPEQKTRRSNDLGASCTLTKKKKVISTKRKSTFSKKSIAGVSKKKSVLARTSLLARSHHTKKGYASSGNDSYIDLSDDEVFTPSQKFMKSTGPITPKFDLRKPLMRSQLRRPKPGEITVSLSGSPLYFEGQQEKQPSKSASCSTKVEIGNKVYHLSDPQKTGNRMDPKQRKQIKELQEKLDLMLKTCR